MLTTKTLLIGLLKDQEHLKRFGYQNKYNRKLQKVEIATEENIFR
jgi:hypothetical protein